MIVYGTKGRVVPGGLKTDAACHACGRSPLQTAGVIRYFHVFWIPVFPYSRLEVLECPSCKAARVGNEVPEPARGEIRRAVFTGRRMLPSFAGAFLLAIAIGAGLVSSAARDEREAEWLAHPAARDHYVVHLPDVLPAVDKAFPYGVVEVAAVAGEVVTVRVPNFAYDRVSGADKAVSSGAFRNADYFADETLELRLGELARLKERNVIRSVVR